MSLTRARRRNDGVVVQIMDDGSEVPIESRTDWARVEAMTDGDLARAVADDPDAAPLLTDEQLARMRVVWPADIAATRRRLGLSQTEFASRPALCATGSRAAACPRGRRACCCG